MESRPKSSLDEAESPFSPPFPSPLPKVIASARAVLTEEPEYLQKWLETTQNLQLERLCREAIAHWLNQTSELTAFAEDTHFVAQLDEITQGFPLYLSYLIDELSRVANQGQAESIHTKAQRVQAVCETAVK